MLYRFEKLPYCTELHVSKLHFLTGKITHWEWRYTGYYRPLAAEWLWPSIDVENSRESIDVCSAPRTYAANDFRSYKGDPRCNIYWETGRSIKRRQFRWHVKTFFSFFHEHGVNGSRWSWELPVNWWINCTAHSKIDLSCKQKQIFLLRILFFLSLLLCMWRPC